jgi:DNA-binding transcriptional LysR family regulator
MDARGVDLSPRLLSLFVVVADHGHLQHAADALRLTPRTLSRAIRELEHEAGEPLLVRDERTVTLTPAGERLTRSARRVLSALDRFSALAQDDAETLRVGHVAGADTMACVLDELCASAAGLNVTELAAPDERQLDDLRHHRLDVAVCVVRGTLHPALESRPLRDDPFVVLDGGVRARPGPLLAARYGVAWPVHDAAVQAAAHATGTAIDSVPVPAGTGRELQALRRRALGRPVLVPSSTVDPAVAAAAPVFADAAALPWRVVWRRDDASPKVSAFVAACERTMAARGWTRPADQSLPAGHQAEVAPV